MSFAWTHRSRGWIAWALWLTAAGAAVIPASRLRIANSLDDWMPEQRTVGSFESYAVIGWPAGSADPVVLGSRLRALPSVAQCIDAPQVNLLGSLLGVTAENFVVGPDGRYLGAFCFRRRGVEDAAFVAEVRSELQSVFPPPAEFHLAGPAVYHITLDQLSQKRLPAILVAITIAGLVVLRVVTDSWHTAAAAIAAIGLSQTILMGVIGAVGWAVDMSMLMVPPLMMSLGLSYAAHWATRQRAAAGVLALCAATTAIGIGSFATTPMASIRHFAMAGSLGIVLVSLAVVSLVPSASDTLRRTTSAAFLRPFLRVILGVDDRQRKLIVAAATLLSAAALAAIPFLRLQTDPLELFPPDDPAVRDFRILDQHLTGLLPFQVTLDRPLDVAPTLAATPGVRKVIDITPVTAGPVRTYWCLADNSAQQRLVEAQPRWQAWARERDTQLEWRGVAAQLAAADRVVLRTAMVALPCMAAIAGIAAAFTTRSVRLALAAAWITLLPVAALWTLIALMGWPLGLPALMIGAITVGVAVDDTLHITALARRHGSARRALLRCWRPCIGSSLAGATALACFAISPFLPTFQFGVLMSASVALAAAANHLVLTSLISPPARGRRAVPSGSHGNIPSGLHVH